MPGWRRLVHQYANYMQMILVGAVVASLIIKQWSTADRRLLDHDRQRLRGNAPGGQGRERDERAQVHDQDHISSPPRRVRGRCLGRPDRPRRRGRPRRRRRGTSRWANRQRQLPPDRRVGPDWRKCACLEGPRHDRWRRGQSRRPGGHGVHEHARHPRQRHHDRDGNWWLHPGRQDRRDVERHQAREDPPDEATRRR